MEPYVTKQNLVSKTKAWLEAIEPVNKHIKPPGRDKAALLVIDMQNYFIDPASPKYSCGGGAVLGNVIYLIECFRRAERPVIFTRHAHRPDGTDAGMMRLWWEELIHEGTPAAELWSDIAPTPEELVLTKQTYSAFHGTDLEMILREQGISELVIAGVKTNLCCETTARDAFIRDFGVFFVADATGTGTEEMHLASLLNLAYGFATVTTTERIAASLRVSG